MASSKALHEGLKKLVTGMTTYADRASASDLIDESYLAALAGRGPSVQAIARWFRSDHVPQEALHGDVAREFQAFTLRLLDLIKDDSVEMAVALQKLLEAKDAAIRAALS